MKKTLFLFALILTIFSCNNNSSEVSLSYTNLDGLIEKKGYFEFTFSEDLIPDSLTGVWEKTAYVKFKPEIEGEYKWSSVNTLVFLPRYELNPASNFTANITNEVLKYSKGKSLKVEQLSFFTKGLELNASKVFWTKKDNKDIVRLSLSFNEKIEPKEVESHLDLKMNGEKVNYTFETTDASKEINLILPVVKKSDDDLVFDINLSKGLVPLGGNNATDEPLLKHALLNSPYNLLVTEVISEHNGTSGSLEVNCTQKIQMKNIKNFISILPKVNYTVEEIDNGFLIKSDKFSATDKYTLVIKKDLQGEIGGKLKVDYSKDVTFGQLKPAIEFLKDRAFYMSSKGAKNIETKIVNVEQVKVIISKVYENNLLTARSSKTFYNTNANYYDNYYNDYYNDYYDDYYSSNQVTKDIIFEEVYTTTDLAKVGSARLLKLDFLDKLKDYKGIYHIDIRSTNDRWLSDSRFVSLSDVGIIAKNGENYMTVFLNSLKTSAAIPNATIKVYGVNNQLAGEGVSGSDGIARISLKNKDISGFRPELITVTSQNNDFNILMLKDTRVSTGSFDLSGIRIPKNGLQTYVYPERDLYRPNEKVNFAVIVRANEWTSPGKIPMKVEIRTPNGKLLKTLKKTLNNEGSFDASFQTVASSQTGAYVINVISSNGVFLASKAIKVEEFMPDRIKVTTNIEDKIYSVDDEVNVNINAQNLFGTPAVGRNYEVEVNYRRKYLYPKGLESYNFYLNNRNDNFDTKVFEGKTDENGNVSKQFIIPGNYKNMGKLSSTIYSTVFDETNRPVNRRNQIEISTQDKYYGIGYYDYYVATNQQLDIPLVAIDKDEKVSNAKAIVKIIKHEYKTILNRSGSYYTYNSQKVEKIMVDKTIDLNGKQNFSFNPALSGRYEIRISSPESPSNYVSSSFYAYSWGSTNNSSFEVNNEGEVDMQFDKEKYEVGENATVLFKTPFDGKLLVTVEREDVMEHFYVETNNRSAEISIITTDEFLPNVFVSATLFKEHKQTDFPLTVAHGYKLMKVNESKRKINVEINAEKESRSKTKQTINIKSLPNSKVTIAVVDEGILQVSGFTTPNPYDYFYQNRALLVNSYDIYPFLFKEISADNAGAGGDGMDLSKRVNPMENNRVKLVSFWSGVVETDSRGKTSFEIDIPQFSGSLRIMAVSHKGNSFGAAEDNMIVADPIILSSSIPRFYSPGDTSIITTTITNTTKKNTKAKAKIECLGPLQVIGDSKQNISINSKGEEQVSFKVFVKNGIGQGKINITCDALGEDFKEETDITIRPATSLLKESGSGTIKSGNTKTIDLNRADFIKSSTDYKLVISKNPMVEFTKQLDYLVRYPYGCSEQTVSAAFPQLYFGEITKALYKDDSKTRDINNNINAAITKLKMRQIYNGGISMWDNMSSDSWWITAYAAHFCIEAKRAGYSVDQAFIDKMLSYLKNKLKSKETITYYYDRGKTKRIAPKEVAYSFYALALSGKSDMSLMNYYKSKTELLSLDSKYLLSAAYALSGDKSKAREILPAAFTGEVSDKQFGGSFYSPIRDEAIALNALIDIDPKNDQIGIMAMHLSKELRERRYMNTQEKVFALMALGKIAKQANESVIAVQVNSGGKKLTNYSEGIATFKTKDIQDGKVEVSVQGEGALYYFWETEGISKTGEYIEEDKYLKIRKTFYNRYGNVITGRSFNINDLVVVKLSVSAAYNKTIENVAITDVLPACFEIENPRTDEIPGTEWIKSQTRPDYIDIRDDRINLFDDIRTYSNGKTQDYYYVVRVVSKGTFKMGPASADAMYNGEYHSYSGGGSISVK